MKLKGGFYSNSGNHHRPSVTKGQVLSNRPDDNEQEVSGGGCVPIGNGRTMRLVKSMVWRASGILFQWKQLREADLPSRKQPAAAEKEFLYSWNSYILFLYTLIYLADYVPRLTCSLARAKGSAYTQTTLKGQLTLQPHNPSNWRILAFVPQPVATFETELQRGKRESHCPLSHAASIPAISQRLYAVV